MPPRRLENDLTGGDGQIRACDLHGLRHQPAAVAATPFSSPTEASWTNRRPEKRSFSRGIQLSTQSRSESLVLLKPETKPDGRQTRNALIALLNDRRPVRGRVVFEHRFQGAGVLPVQQVDDLREQFPSALRAVRPPCDAQVDPREQRKPRRVQ